MPSTPSLPGATTISTSVSLYTWRSAVTISTVSLAMKFSPDRQFRSVDRSGRQEACRRGPDSSWGQTAPRARGPGAPGNERGVTTVTVPDEDTRAPDLTASADICQLGLTPLLQDVAEPTSEQDRTHGHQE